MDATETDDADSEERIATPDQFPAPVTATLEGIFAHLEGGRDRTHAQVTVRSTPGDPTTAAAVAAETPACRLGLELTADEAREIGAALIASAEQSEEVIVK